MTRLVSWNVNGIRACIRKGFWDWYKSSRSDVVCLQETKITEKDFLKIALRTADPLVTEVLQLHHWYSGFACQAFDQVGLASADRTTDEVAHGHGLMITLIPQGDVLTDPGFDGILAVKLVERPIGLDELDQTHAFFLHQLLLETHQIVAADGFLQVLLLLEQS